MRKEIVGIDIFVTCWNCDREKHVAYQNSEQTSFENKEVELVEPVQIKFCESNTYRKGLSWLHFDKPRIQDWQQVKENLVMKSKYFCRTFQSNNKA